ncbi:T9SS type A sorting domain-containing protein [candidate division KSB1 bacterium]|nr:T9SS type A sorting domain-containing protein [candidate division KSB1 bacterium]
MSEQVFQDWDGIKWVNFFRFIPSFDESGNLIELVLQNWDGTKWVDSTRSRIIFSYNESGGVSELKLQEWDGTDWVDIYRDILSYDESRNLIEQVRQDWDGSNWVNNNRIICTFESITGIDGNISGTLTKFTLKQNYRNPFNPTTVISYHLSEGSDVELTIYNQLGQVVRTLVRGTQSAGGHRVQWDGRDDGGKQVVSGVYLYRLKGGSFIQTRTMLLLR